MQCPSGALQNPTSPQILGRVGASCIFALIFLPPSRAAKRNVQTASRIISVLLSLAFTELLPSGIHINKLAVASRGARPQPNYLPTDTFKRAFIIIEP